LHLAIYHYEVFGGKALATLIFGAYDKQKAKAVKQALKLLISEGVTSPKTVPAAV